MTFRQNVTSQFSFTHKPPHTPGPALKENPLIKVSGILPQIPPRPSNYADIKRKIIENNTNHAKYSFAQITKKGLTNILKIHDCYESPKQEKVSHTFKHLIQNLKAYNGIRI